MGRAWWGLVSHFFLLLVDPIVQYVCLNSLQLYFEIKIINYKSFFVSKM